MKYLTSASISIIILMISVFLTGALEINTNSTSSDEFNSTIVTIDSPNNLETTDSSMPFAEFNLEYDEDECITGGEGATSCSHMVKGTGCSVSCSDGFYACCNLQCKCERTDSDIREN